MIQRAWAVVAAHLRVLALERDAAPLPWGNTGQANVIWLGLHALALIGVGRLAHWPWWGPVVAWGLFGLGLFVPGPRGQRRGAEAFAPLFGVYGVAVVRLFIVYGLRRQAPEGLSYEAALLCAGAWAGLMSLRHAQAPRLAVVMAGLLALCLWSWQLWRLAPAGVTGSDPFAYVQMAVDLAERGTARHAFPLAVLAARLGLPTLPATHVGYVLPNAEGLAPTVWPPGFSVLLAGAYQLGGEEALLSFNVGVALVSALLTLWLAARLAPAGWRKLPVAFGAAAVFALATCAEMFLRLSAPLADGAALAFTALAVALTLETVRRAQSRRGLKLGWVALLGAAAGLALGGAYAVRYTQVLIGPGLVVAAWVGLQDRRQRLAFIGPLALGAALVALPDVLYRVSLYGSPFRFGTGELALFSWQALPEALARLAPEFLAAGELGWLWPFILLGGVYAWRRNRFALGVVAAAYGPLFVFHIWYPFVRMRDLLALYVPLAGLAALGGVVAAVWLWRRRGMGWTALRIVAVLLVLLGVGWRLRLLTSWDAGYFTFGYLRDEQRADLETLSTLTEPNAVIAASLNSGAIELYGQRLAVRPGNELQPGASWSEAEWLIFAAALRAEGRPLYVLMDSTELNAPLAAVRQTYGVTEAARLNVPVYFIGGGSRNETVVLWRVDD